MGRGGNGATFSSASRPGDSIAASACSALNILADGSVLAAGTAAAAAATTVDAAGAVAIAAAASLGSHIVTGSAIAATAPQLYEFDRCEAGPFVESSRARQPGPLRRLSACIAARRRRLPVCIIAG